MRISDWSSDVCSSDLGRGDARLNEISHDPAIGDDLSLIFGQRIFGRKTIKRLQPETAAKSLPLVGLRFDPRRLAHPAHCVEPLKPRKFGLSRRRHGRFPAKSGTVPVRSEEPPSELQSL